MISISSLIYDLEGHVVINELPTTIYPIIERRASRTATLDGDSSINDMGYSAGDGVFVVRAYVTREQSFLIETMVKAYPLVILSSKMGCFLGVIKSLDNSKDKIEFTFLVQKKLSE